MAITTRVIKTSQSCSRCNDRALWLDNNPPSALCSVPDCECVDSYTAEIKNGEYTVQVCFDDNEDAAIDFLYIFNKASDYHIEEE